MKPETYIVSDEYAGQRLDKLAVHLYPEFSRSFLQRLVKDGAILVNAKKVTKHTFLKERDEITFTIPKQETFTLTADANVIPDVIFADQNYIVVNKPAGMVVHPGTKREQGTLAAGLLVDYPELTTIGDQPKLRPGIVHRLDKDTSGVLVVARTPAAFDSLKQQFHDKHVQKQYLALVEGRIKKSSGDIEGYMIRSSRDPVRRTLFFKEIPSGRYSKTHLDVVKWFQRYTLVNLFPATGRTHQLRVHMKSYGHPVVADMLYGQPHKTLKRQFLHAKSIAFTDLEGQKRYYEAPLAQELKNYLKQLTPTQ